MEREANLVGAFKGLVPPAPIQVRPATVVSVEGRTCTVDIVGTDLTSVDGVNLCADEEGEEGLLLTPKVGSLVYVAMLENSSGSLFVCLATELESLDATIGKASIHLEADETTVQHDQAVIRLSGGVVTIENNTTNLASLCADLLGILESFQVVCASPGAPSPSVFPATLAKITTLKAKFKQLLK
ncbi:hypothetical protein ACAW74_25670 [Fibrella sp. WM1]|uniref:hypothetical protein n=1 Tax=Fibrella musci TaxID=3242485 RepID=UPI003520A28C